MGAWGTLLATIAGAAIALVGQHLVKRSEERARISELLFEQCAMVAASSTEFRDRIWEERHLGLEGRVASWDLSALRLATARLHILSKDEVLLSSVDQLNRAGRRLGSCWRRGDVSDADYSDLWDEHDAAMKQFVAASGKAVRRRLSHT
ncbi:hypothetical protein J7E88_04880 [Streptomyces sp. ISL-10]|uniref:hypothetical protein n=1 Tax=Streptomyces sp. ISL-10 TaxID=2819172 RepID=UPI001BE66CF9|nr:hypothetical protein [Streptomyces sp. ISL-10]MBT2364667.1 hypothetical protein [Streptomyces sp. ISL-10]